MPAEPPPSPLPIWKSERATTIAAPTSVTMGCRGLNFLISVMSVSISLSTATRFWMTLPFHCRLSVPRGSPQTFIRTGSTTSNISGSRPQTLRTVSQFGAFSPGITLVVRTPSLPFHATPGSQPSACSLRGLLADSSSFWIASISSSCSDISAHAIPTPVACDVVVDPDLVAYLQPLLNRLVSNRG